MRLSWSKSRGLYRQRHLVAENDHFRHNRERTHPADSRYIYQGVQSNIDCCVD
jgi:hypothetical protein